MKSKNGVGSWLEVPIVSVGTACAAFVFTFVLFLVGAVTEAGSSEAWGSHRSGTALVGSVLLSTTGIVILFIPLLVIGLGAGVATRIILRSGERPNRMAALGGLLGATTAAAVTCVAYCVFGSVGMSVFPVPPHIFVLLATAYGAVIGALYILIRMSAIARN